MMAKAASRAIVISTVAACVFAFADSNARAAPPPPAPYNWSGFYLGGYVGWGWGSSPWSNPDEGTLGTAHLGGPIGSLQAGYNLQYGRFVTGIEASAGLSGVHGNFTADNWGFSTSWRSYESVAGRFGMTTPNGQTLLFAKVGAVWGQTTLTSDWPEIDTHFESHKTVAGLLVGGGFEWQWTRNWSAKAELDYFGFPHSTLSLTPNTDVPAFPVTSSYSIWSVQVGVNYRFSGF